MAHIDSDSTNSDIDNVMILCPTCRKTYDLDLISTDTIVLMRDREKTVDWSKRMKDAAK